ncbi:MAG: MarR family transcriptional regulator [Spirochaetaceae bacterium]|nr:MAG: MarR family transcriptional regulator [Spirochaetaceae bacterium]
MNREIADSLRPSTVDRRLTRQLRAVAAFCPGYNLRRADKTVSRWFDEEFRGAAITASQFTVLLNLALRSPLSTGDLSERLNSDLSTVSRNMEALVRSRLVEVVRGGDRRRREYALSGEGRLVINECLPRWKAAQARTMRRVGRGRWMVALSALKRLYEE